MPDHAVRDVRVVYDAERDQPHLREAFESDRAAGTIFDHEHAPTGRRRPAHDWGADDLFIHMPGPRRFDRPGARSRHLELVHDASGSGTVAGAEDGADARREQSGFAGTGSAAGSSVGRRTQAVVEQFQGLREPDDPESPATIERLPDDVEGAPAVIERLPIGPEPLPAAAAGGRPTVTITGRPGEHADFARVPARRRPPRTMEERFGARPDRIAAWACGLGFLLILLAVATADAAPL